MVGKDSNSKENTDDVHTQKSADNENCYEKNKKAIMACGATSLVNQFCMFIYFAFMPFLYTKYGVSPVVYGYIMSTFNLVTCLLSPLVGYAADNIGARNVIIFTMVSMSLTHLLQGIAYNTTMLLLSRAASLLFDMLPVSVMTITDLVSISERGQYMSKIYAPTSIGMITGPFCGSFLARYLGTQGTLLITWILPLLTLPFVFVFIPLKKKQQTESQTSAKEGNKWEKVKSLLGKGDIPFLLLLRLLTTLPGMLFLQNWAIAFIKMNLMTPEKGSMVFMSLGIINMVNTWYAVPWLLKNLRSDILMKYVPFVSIIAFLLLSFTQDVWGLIMCLPLVNISYAIMENQVMQRLTKSVETKDTSTMVGVATAVFNVSRTISPLLGGYMISSVGWSGIGQAGFFTSILTATLTFIKYR